MMFARRMLEMEADGRYADVMERARYNIFTLTRSKLIRKR